MRGTGLLDAYESVVGKLVTQGWPNDKNVFDHAAYELLKWQSEHREEYANNILVNPGATGLAAIGDRPQSRPSIDYL